ncbi:protein of unknown function [Nitrospira defluvii]|uniref:Uncharacterized protein n=1 Tax=Nitrospira defluvii TaxID=330214 RepID=D8P7J0_9BACT|nr:protein of unknown function [Nitrospira defluvii]
MASLSGGAGTEYNRFSFLSLNFFLLRRKAGQSSSLERDASNVTRALYLAGNKRVSLIVLSFGPYPTCWQAAKKVRQRRSRKTLPPHRLGGVHRRDALYSARREPQRLTVRHGTRACLGRLGVGGYEGTIRP